MTSLLGSTPCVSFATTRPACNHSLILRTRPTCPAAFRSQSQLRHHGSRRTTRIVVHAAAATQQNVKMPSWEQMHKQLTTQHRLESVSPTEAQKLVKSGKFVLVDVRPPDVFEKAHPEGARVHHFSSLSSGHNQISRNTCEQLPSWQTVSSKMCMQMYTFCLILCMFLLNI